jgi:hypothetical protein
MSKYACECHYKTRPEIKIYGWENKPCCWCRVYVGTDYKFFSKDGPISGHTILKVECDEGGFGWTADIFPAELNFYNEQVGYHFIALGETEINIPADATQIQTYNYHFKGTISCSGAEKWRSYLKEKATTNYLGEGTCIGFARSTAYSMVNDCP